MPTVAFACLMLLAACERSVPTGEAEATVPIRITAVVGVPIATLVVEVTAPDIAPPLVFNLTVVDGVASGTIRLPPGPGRTISVTAVDEEGGVTHEGSVTLDVRPGQNAPVQIRLSPRSGHVPITVTFGNFGVVVTPAEATIDVTVAATFQLAVTVTDVNGQVLAAPEVVWATTNPAVAAVSAAGLVTGVANGTATLVATYEGVAGLSAITVTGAGGGPNPGSPEVCDGVDNDLDGQSDDGLVYCVDGVAMPNTDGATCLAGFADANGEIGDGCEFAGSDGVYVSPTGNDANAGTRQAPLRTVQAGIARAVSRGIDRVNIAEGMFTGPVTLVTGIDLYGGYDGVTWLRDVAANRTIIAASGQPVVTGSSVSAMTLDGLTITALDAASVAGASSYAVVLQNSDVVITASQIIAGHGWTGSDGFDGSAGENGGDGAAGSPGDPDGAAGLGGKGGLNSQCQVAGGGGGDGGATGDFAGVNGGSGLGLAAGAGGAGGAGNAGIGAGWPGGNGTSGSPGVAGSPGVGGVGLGTFVGFGYVPVSGGAGSAGTNGSGGGGGGGGGGQEGGIGDPNGGGNGGGGGGAGGCGGEGGTGGQGGGGSFALVLLGGSNLVITNSTIQTGSAGNGGRGGTGGAGGVPGQGRLGAVAGFGEIGAGGSGGGGAQGGPGGHGGGGAGGPTIGILAVSSSFTQSGNVFLLGAPGSGGSSMVNVGATGVSQNTYTR